MLINYRLRNKMQKKVYTVLYYELYILKEIAFVMGRDGG